MRQRVTVVLVARNGGDTLERTLSRLAEQTRTPDELIAVDVASRDDTAALLARAQPSQLMTLPPRAPATFGAAVGHAVLGTPVQDPDAEWVWLLAHDSAPHPRALEQLLGAVEIAPSVAIAGPKIMTWDRPDVIAEFGESMTRFGASVSLVEGELDQAQHDVTEDVMGVAANGMLVRRSVFEALGGFDSGLPSIDAGLDLCVRARLAGHRVMVVPGAKITALGGPERFDGHDGNPRRHARLARIAQLHRRFVYSPALAVPVHWLSLLPLAVLRSIWHLLAKRPGRIPGEFTAAVVAAFDGSVPAARRALGRARRLGWKAIAPLRVTAAELRERRGQAREAFSATGTVVDDPRIGYLGGGGLWVAVFGAIAGVIAFGPLLTARAATGGGLLPLGASVGDLWSAVGVGWRDIGAGFFGPADPFAAIVAVLGSLTFWEPSLSIIAFHLLALPLASMTAWFAARRITRSPWIPLVASVLWSLAPPYIASLMSGHLPSAIAHILLPWFLLALLKGARSVSSAALAALLFAGIAACAPVLVPALLLGWLAWMIASPKGIGRLIAMPVLAAALFAPLVIEQVLRGTPLALLADPGAPAAAGATSGWHLALVSASEGLGGWTDAAARLALPGVGAHIIVASLLAPVGILALLSLVMPGIRRAVPALAVALLGFATAVASTHIAVTALGAETVPVWPGSGLSLFWLGLVGAVVVALEGLAAAGPVVRDHPAGGWAGVVASLAVLALSMPLLLAMHLGHAAIEPSDARLVPAVVAAEARTDPAVGTLLLTPTAEGALLATVQRGTGSTLEDQSTLAATSVDLSDDERTLARLAGNLASRGAYDPQGDLEELHIGFVVLADREAPAAEPSGAAQQVAQRTIDSLDGSADVTAVGETDLGLLWRIADPPRTAPEERPGPLDTLEGRVVAGVQGGIALITLLLAVPTQRRRPTRMQTLGEGPATTFDEDLDD
ncbi:glycosyltransferase family 2 protein [Salinibacterium sp. SYSU T00001]|uniref:glycosyltransferase family 2 protein n=1 Tax=Homoserinimonas sedimenticola TaxID=2986805 RepID=UPI0022362074|nr:glycosyltransferase family 2 protein [Salinibacterium sedimenticola]MCW4385006.1 glycosyltransferase family 2 protein [Salinibacterium sedimenticola]